MAVGLAEVLEGAKADLARAQEAYAKDPSAANAQWVADCQANLQRCLEAYAQSEASRQVVEELQATVVTGIITPEQAAKNAELMAGAQQATQELTAKILKEETAKAAFAVVPPTVDIDALLREDAELKDEIDLIDQLINEGILVFAADSTLSWETCEAIYEVLVALNELWVRDRARRAEIWKTVQPYLQPQIGFRLASF